jgi:uncharacterized protein YndB with AHSA1/START domain
MAPSVATETSGVSPVTITHVFQAPHELMWAAWTRPVHIRKWWAPEMFTTPSCQVDVRPTL